MDFEWTRTQARTRSLFFEFAREEVAARANERDENATFPFEVWTRLAELGFWREHVPEDYGGAGGSLWDFLAAFEGLASGAEDFGLLLSAIAHAGLIQVLLDHGSLDQRARHVPPLVVGGIGATAATEPAGGSHVAAVATTATPGGDGYVLRGHKSHITNAPVADLVLVVGRIPSLGPRDITLFLVDSHAKGVLRGPPENLMGTRSSPAGDIVLSGVRVSERDIVGGPGEGLTTLYSFLAFDRLMYGVAVAGFLEPFLARALQWTRERMSFRVQLAQHEYVQEKLVVVKLVMETARALAYRAADAFCRNDPSASLHASLAKLASAEGMVGAGLELIQVFGHKGYEHGSGFERVLRDAVALRIAGGTTEMQKLNVFKQLVTAADVPLGHELGTTVGSGR